MSIYLEELYKDSSKLEPLFVTLFEEGEKTKVQKITKKEDGLVIELLVPDSENKELVNEVLFLTEKTMTFLYNVNLDIDTKLYRLFMLDEFGLAYAYDCLI